MLASTKAIAQNDQTNGTYRNKCLGLLTLHSIFTPFTSNSKQQTAWSYFNQNLSHLWEVHDRVPLCTLFTRSYCPHLQFSCVSVAYVWQDDADQAITTLVGLTPRETREMQDFGLWSEEARHYAYNLLFEIIKHRKKIILEPLNNAVTRRKTAITKRHSTSIFLGTKATSITV